MYEDRHAAVAAGGDRGAAFEVVEGDFSRGLLVLCDHARNTIPAEYDGLGLPAGELERHIAYDIGAEAVARGLARRLGAPAVVAAFSRLLIDPNRGEDDPTLIMRLSDGAVVPGNAGLTEEERERRLARFHRPYHRAIDVAIGRAAATGRMPALLSIHSFTPSWKGVPRPWHVGILWGRDQRLAKPLIAALEREGGLVVGDNEPYSGELEGDTLNVHGSRRGLAHALVEIRQDLIADDRGAAEWAERLARITGALMADAEIGRSLCRGRTG